MSLKNVVCVSIILLFVAGCSVEQDGPRVVRQNFDDVDLSSHENCKGVLLVEGVYDIEIAVFVAGDVAKGEIAIGDSTMQNGNRITIKGIESNKKKWESATKTHRVGLNFERQIEDDSYSVGELICFN